MGLKAAHGLVCDQYSVTDGIKQEQNILRATATCLTPIAALTLVIAYSRGAEILMHKVAESEIEFTAIRSSGPGGQHANKVSTAVRLRFDVCRSSLPREVKECLLACPDRRINSFGCVVIKAQRFRSQDKNKQDAIARLQTLIGFATRVNRKRIATEPGRASKERRLQQKKKTGDKKLARGSVRSLDD